MSLNGQLGFLDGGHFHSVGYNANFTSTSGNLSAQFGLHYLNLRRNADIPVLHGLSGTATALFSIPATERFDNGIPKVAIAFYIGMAPSALLNGRWNDLTLPLAVGFGVPLSPGRGVTFTPWFEFAPSINLDTSINPYLFGKPISSLDDLGGIIQRNENGEITGIKQPSVEEILAKSVRYRVSTVVGARAGFVIGFHGSESMDLDFKATLGSLGSAFSGSTVVQLGAGLTFRWDKIVPSVLPAERRLEGESCDAVARRHAACTAKRPPVYSPYRKPQAAPSGPKPVATPPSPSRPGSAQPTNAVQPRPATPPSAATPPPATPTAPPTTQPPSSAFPPVTPDGAPEKGPGAPPPSAAPNSPAGATPAPNTPSEPGYFPPPPPPPPPGGY